MTRYVFPSAAMVLLSLLLPGARAEAKEVVIADFETPEDLAKWTTREAKAETVEDHATLGVKAAKIIYQPGPGFRSFMIETGRNKIDLTGCTHIVLDVFAPRDVTFTFKLKSNDGAQQWSKVFTAGPAMQKISVALDTTGLDIARIDYVNLFVSDPAQPLVLFVDAIRGVAESGPAQASPAPKPAADPAADVLIMDFETPEDLQRWTLGGSTAVLSEDNVTRGKKCALVTYQRGDGIRTFMYDIGGRKIADLTGCTHLLIDVFAPVNMDVTLKLKSGGGKAQWVREYTLEPAPWTISVPLEQTGLDPSSLSYINIFVGNPRGDMVLYVDNIRGTRGAQPKADLPVKKEKPDEEMF